MNEEYESRKSIGDIQVTFKQRMIIPLHILHVLIFIINKPDSGNEMSFIISEIERCLVLLQHVNKSLKGHKKSDR